MTPLTHLDADDARDDFPDLIDAGLDTERRKPREIDPDEQRDLELEAVRLADKLGF